MKEIPHAHRYAPDGSVRNSFFYVFSRSLRDILNAQIEKGWDELQFEMKSFLIAAMKAKPMPFSKKNNRSLNLLAVLRSCPPPGVPNPPFGEDAHFYTFLDIFIDWIAAFVEVAMGHAIRITKTRFLAQEWDLGLIQAFVLSQYDISIAHMKSQCVRRLYKEFRLVLAKEIRAYRDLEDLGRK